MGVGGGSRPLGSLSCVPRSRAKAAGGRPGERDGNEIRIPGRGGRRCAGRTATPPPVGLGARTNWQVSTSRSPIDDDIAVQLATSSKNEIEDEEGTFRPTLVLRCEGHELEVSVVTGRPARQLPGFEDEHTVTIRFGESPARDVRARSRFESRVLLLEPAADVIREMLQSDTLSFSFTPLSLWPAPQAVEMSFDLAGLRDAVPELNETCAI